MQSRFTFSSTSKECVTLTEYLDVSFMGHWATEFRFVFEPPLALPEGSVPPVITSFDVTPLVGKVPDLRDRRDAMLREFVWDTTLDIPEIAKRP